MPEFSKLFPHLSRLFPPFGRGMPNPRAVSDDVTLTHDLYRSDLKHNFYFTHHQGSAVFAGVGVAVSATCVPEPGPGYVNWAYSAAVLVNPMGAGQSRRIFLRTLPSGNPQNDFPTGVWPDAAIISLDYRHSAMYVVVPLAMPVPRGNIIEARTGDLVAGETLFAVSHSVQLPIEVCTFIPRSIGSMVSYTAGI